MRDSKIQKIVFFGLLAVLLAAGSVLVSPKHMNLKDRVTGRNESIAGVLSEPEHTLDVLVLGDSLAYYSVSPMELWSGQGITSYVCGQSGQNMTEAYHVLKQTLRTQSPKVVVLEVNAAFRSEDSFSELRLALAEEVYDRLPMLRFHDVWKSFAGKKESSRGVYYKGFHVDSSINPYDTDDYMSTPGEREEMNDWVYTYLDKIRKLCENRGIELLLISSPSPLNWNHQRHDAVMSYAKEKNLPYVDMNLKEVGPKLDWMEDTLDNGDHVNYYGAKKISDFLGSYLSEHYDLPDHRGDEAYAAWEAEAGIYRQEVKEKNEQ